MPTMMARRIVIPMKMQATNDHVVHFSRHFFLRRTARPPPTVAEPLINLRSATSSSSSLFMLSYWSHLGGGGLDMLKYLLCWCSLALHIY